MSERIDLRPRNCAASRFHESLGATATSFSTIRGRSAATRVTWAVSERLLAYGIQSVLQSDGGTTPLGFGRSLIAVGVPLGKGTGHRIAERNPLWIHRRVRRVHRIHGHSPLIGVAIEPRSCLRVGQDPLPDLFGGIRVSGRQAETAEVALVRDLEQVEFRIESQEVGVVAKMLRIRRKPVVVGGTDRSPPGWCRTA